MGWFTRKLSKSQRRGIYSDLLQRIFQIRELSTRNSYGDALAIAYPMAKQIRLLDKAASWSKKHLQDKAAEGFLISHDEDVELAYLNSRINDKENGLILLLEKSEKNAFGIEMGNAALQAENSIRKILKFY